MDKKMNNNVKARITEVHAIYTEKKAIGVSTENIWKMYVYPRFFISRVTFFRYLNTKISHAESNISKDKG